MGSVPWLGRSAKGGHSKPLQQTCLKNPHGQRSLVVFSPRGCKELDTTERLSTHREMEPFSIFLFQKELLAVLSFQLYNPIHVSKQT